MRATILLALATAVGLGAAPPTQSISRTPVSLLRVPGGGLQPQAVVDEGGVLHVVYFTGPPGDGNLFYVRADSGGGPFTVPVRVNSEPDSAIATGNVRGARLAVTPGGVHVAWNGSSRAVPRGPNEATPMLYARLPDTGTAFEPQRNLATSATGLDGGGAIAATPEGRVVVLWHAGGPTSNAEGDRRVWTAESVDGGRRFSREHAISDPATGACGCCGMASTFDESGSLYLLYRSARDLVHRDTYLLHAADADARVFSSRQLDSWTLPACSMSTYALAAQGTRVWAAWENDGRIHFARVDRPSVIQTVPGDPQDRKHPALAVNTRGELLVAWTEGMGWNRGGSLGWQVFAADGSPTSQRGREDGVPVWSLVAAVAQPGGSFTVIY